MSLLTYNPCSYDRLRIEYSDLEEQTKSFDAHYDRPWREQHEDDRVEEPAPLPLLGQLTKDFLNGLDPKKMTMELCIGRAVKSPNMTGSKIDNSQIL
jgi:hypothetical protein